MQVKNVIIFFTSWKHLYNIYSVKVNEINQWQFWLLQGSGMSMFICVNSMIENIQKRISLMG